MSEEMFIEDILKYLPHRPPFLLIDRVVEFVPGQSLVALKNVTINEPFFVGHFPGKPVMPGVLILEALAQASSFLATKSLNEYATNENLAFFAGIDNARFKRIVVPGDQLRLEVQVLKVRQNIMKCHCIAKVDGEVVCEADLMSARKKGKEGD